MSISWRLIGRSNNNIYTVAKTISEVLKILKAQHSFIKFKFAAIKIKGYKALPLSCLRFFVIFYQGHKKALYCYLASLYCPEIEAYK